MGDNRGQTIFLSVIGIATLLVAIIGATFAYFTTTMQGQAKDVTVNAAQLGTIKYETQAVTGSNILPGWDSGDKTVTITATKGQSTFEYECNLVVSTNTASTDSNIVGASAFTDLYVTATTGTGAELDNALAQGKEVKIDGTSVPQTIPLATGTISPSESTLVHNFTYKITFKETEVPQNEQQGASIAATVSCKLSSGDTIYYNNDNPQGTEKNPFEE